MNHLPSAKFRRALQPYGANLEFRDSCCRVGRWVRENVGRRLPEVERDKEDTRVHPAPHFGRKNYRAAARGHLHAITILHADFLRVGAVYLDERPRDEAVQAFAPPSHRPRVVVLQHPTRGQHYRE